MRKRDILLAGGLAVGAALLVGPTCTRRANNLILDSKLGYFIPGTLWCDETNLVIYGALSEDDPKNPTRLDTTAFVARVSTSGESRIDRLGSGIALGPSSGSPGDGFAVQIESPSTADERSLLLRHERELRWAPEPNVPNQLVGLHEIVDGSVVAWSYDAVWRRRAGSNTWSRVGILEGRITRANSRPAPVIDNSGAFWAALDWGRTKDRNYRRLVRIVEDDEVSGVDLDVTIVALAPHPIDGVWVAGATASDDATALYHARKVGSRIVTELIASLQGSRVERMGTRLDTLVLIGTTDAGASRTMLSKSRRSITVSRDRGRTWREEPDMVDANLCCLSPQGRLWLVSSQDGHVCRREL